MTDLLLKFPNEETAGKVGEALGCASLIGDKWEFATTHNVAICPIGENFVPTGKMTTSEIGSHQNTQGDGNFWAMVRIMKDAPVPEDLAAFIVKRESGNPSQPSSQWA